ncbi:hypothetical protein An01g07710 [Aspergillus niger]|uniref:Uncharacterized protein n=2 Tax=Aspergillus niger TaxID=5061 RepID=A2Q9F6_ASPNC|nr:hypothetical protein An01g07710 [Aspergillus niger]CAK43868.1 hypothetical protein An01g07710 [Aspergillus niger]
MAWVTAGAKVHAGTASIPLQGNTLNVHNFLQGREEYDLSTRRGEQLKSSIAQSEIADHIRLKLMHPWLNIGY